MHVKCLRRRSEAWVAARFASMDEPSGITLYRPIPGG